MSRDLTEHASALFWLLDCVRESTDNSIKWSVLGDVICIGRPEAEEVEINLTEGILTTASKETFQLHTLEQIVQVLTETGIFPENISF